MGIGSSIKDVTVRNVALYKNLVNGLAHQESLVAEYRVV